MSTNPTRFGISILLLVLALTLAKQLKRVAPLEQSLPVPKEQAAIQAEERREERPSFDFEFRVLNDQLAQASLDQFRRETELQNL
ncbi:MAG: hypothetical protein KGQ59_10660, partial [Bdellovibrionales bacterium]|nr:hypothetical protein [Bdellovibrionales bacterium]